MSIVVAVDVKTDAIEVWVRGGKILLSRKEAGQLASFLGQALRVPRVLDRCVGYEEITRGRNKFGLSTIS